jgi:predicted component of type VI protein secretion system
LLERREPHREPVGQQHVRPADEVVRFRSHTSLSFPPSEIYEIVRTQDETQQAQMTVAFMGLTGWRPPASYQT